MGCSRRHARGQSHPGQLLKRAKDEERYRNEPRPVQERRRRAEGDAAALRRVDTDLVPTPCNGWRRRCRKISLLALGARSYGVAQIDSVFPDPSSRTALIEYSEGLQVSSGASCT